MSGRGVRSTDRSEERRGVRARQWLVAFGLLSASCSTGRTAPAPTPATPAAGIAHSRATREGPAPSTPTDGASPVGPAGRPSDDASAAERARAAATGDAASDTVDSSGKPRADPRESRSVEPTTGSRHGARRQDEDPGPRCPPEMALVSDVVCVDRWEASLLERGDDGSEEPWSPYQAPHAAIDRLRAVSQGGQVPQGYISGSDAEAACVRSGKRLCTAREWELTCRGPERWAYPYGPNRERGACNDDGRGVHPVVEASRRMGLPPERMWYEGMDSPLINQLPDTVRPTGASSRCVGEYGTFDMVGNLHEWIEDPAGTFRGGYFMDTLINGEGCSYATTAHGFGYHDYSTGFRCCLDPDPIE